MLSERDDKMSDGKNTSREKLQIQEVTLKYF